jgi:hypothetical protein
MPLAPLGCNAQVHEKTDLRGTWAIHSVNGWYLSTSPEHYHTHCCHIKMTNTECHSDTVQFQHKHMTNPSLTPEDKLMAAIADCSKALQGLSAGPSTEIQEFKLLLHQTNQHLLLPHQFHGWNNRL